MPNSVYSKRVGDGANDGDATMTYRTALQTSNDAGYSESQNEDHDAIDRETADERASEMAGMHPFEKAGLGIAPFAYVGSDYRVGPMPVLNAAGHPTGMTVGAPGQPCGSCDYCGTGIAECCIIRDADGKRFIVGNVCVQKTLGSTDTISKRAKRDNDRARRVRTKAGEAARIVALDEALATDADLRALISAQPHPRGFDGMTMLDWARWMWANSSHTGKLKVVRKIDKLRKVSK